MRNFKISAILVGILFANANALDNPKMSSEAIRNPGHPDIYVDDQQNDLNGVNELNFSSDYIKSQFKINTMTNFGYKNANQNTARDNKFYNLNTQDSKIVNLNFDDKTITTAGMTAFMYKGADELDSATFNNHTINLNGKSNATLKLNFNPMIGVNFENAAKLQITNNNTMNINDMDIKLNNILSTVKNIASNVANSPTNKIAIANNNTLSIKNSTIKTPDKSSQSNHAYNINSVDVEYMNVKEAINNKIIIDNSNLSLNNSFNSEAVDKRAIHAFASWYNRTTIEDAKVEGNAVIIKNASQIAARDIAGASIQGMSVKNVNNNYVQIENNSEEKVTIDAIVRGMYSDAGYSMQTTGSRNYVEIIGENIEIQKDLAGATYAGENRRDNDNNVYMKIGSGVEVMDVYGDTIDITGENYENGTNLKAGNLNAGSKATLLKLKEAEIKDINAKLIDILISQDSTFGNLTATGNINISETKNSNFGNLKATDTIAVVDSEGSTFKDLTTKDMSVADTKNANFGNLEATNSITISNSQASTFGNLTGESVTIYNAKNSEFKNDGFVTTNNIKSNEFYFVGSGLIANSLDTENAFFAQDDSVNSNIIKLSDVVFTENLKANTLNISGISQDAINSKEAIITAKNFDVTTYNIDLSDVELENGTTIMKVTGGEKTNLTDDKFNIQLNANDANFKNLFSKVVLIDNPNGFDYSGDKYSQITNYQKINDAEISSGLSTIYKALVGVKDDKLVIGQESDFKVEAAGDRLEIYTLNKDGKIASSLNKDDFNIKVENGEIIITPKNSDGETFEPLKLSANNIDLSKYDTSKIDFEKGVFYLLPKQTEPNRPVTPPTPQVNPKALSLLSPLTASLEVSNRLSDQISNELHNLNSNGKNNLNSGYFDNNVSADRMTVFANISGFLSNYESGNVDIDGYSAIAGVAASDYDNAMIGAFVEYANANFEANLNSIKSTGDIEAIGGGLLGKIYIKDNFYIDAYAKIGKFYTDYESSYVEKFEIKPTYYGTGIALGYFNNYGILGVDSKLGFNNSKLQDFSQELTGKNGLKEKFEFKEVISNRAKFDNRFLFNLGTFRPYINANFEYEFSGSNTFITKQLLNEAKFGNKGFSAGGGLGLSYTPNMQTTLNLEVNQIFGVREESNARLAVEVRF